MLISASEARRTLFSLIERVNEDRDAVEIVSRKGNVVSMAADRQIVKRVNTLINACLRERFTAIAPVQLA